ncbi:MAG: DUF3667 domain-containing protein [Bacteroidota bacterium]
MNSYTSKICHNCGFESESPFQYCPNCGQKNTDGKITLSALWAEFKDAVFNIESRTWRTLKNLFIPGRLTVEYFSGRHRQYLHPLRLLLATSVLFIIAMSFQEFQSATNHSYNVKDRILKNYERQRLYRVLVSITDSTHKIFPQQQTQIITDTILTALNDSLRNLLFESGNKFANKYGDKYGDSIDVNHYASFGSKGIERISKRDFLNMDEEELAAVYKKEASILDRLILKQKVKLIKDESKLSAALIGHSTWAFLLMMPCLALVLYLLYIRRRYFYVEHLIFAFHFQAFSFIVLTFLIAGIDIFPRWIFLMFGAITWVYLFISMLQVYKQSRVKTLLKSLLFSISYGGLFVLLLIGTIFISFILL